MTLVERNLSSTSYGNTDKASITQSIHHTSTPQKYSPGAYQAYSLNSRSFLTPFPGHFQSCIRAIPSLVLRNFPALYLDIVPLNSGQFPASYSGNSLLHTRHFPASYLDNSQPLTQLRTRVIPALYSDNSGPSILAFPSLNSLLGNSQLFTQEIPSLISRTTSSLSQGPPTPSFQLLRPIVFCTDRIQLITHITGPAVIMKTVHSKGK